MTSSSKILERNVFWNKQKWLNKKLKLNKRLKLYKKLVPEAA